MVEANISYSLTHHSLLITAACRASPSIISMSRLRQLVPAIVASVGGAMYGVDTGTSLPIPAGRLPNTSTVDTNIPLLRPGIIATTIGHRSFNMYMFPPDGKDAVLTGTDPACYCYDRG